MESAAGTIERAYELARSGTVDTLATLIRQLKLENCESVEAHLAGPSLRRELRAICQAAWSEAGQQPGRQRSDERPRKATTIAKAKAP